MSRTDAVILLLSLLIATIWCTQYKTIVDKDKNYLIEKYTALEISHDSLKQVHIKQMDSAYNSWLAHKLATDSLKEDIKKNIKALKQKPLALTDSLWNVYYSQLY